HGLDIGKRQVWIKLLQNRTQSWSHGIWVSGRVYAELYRSRSRAIFRKIDGQCGISVKPAFALVAGHANHFGREIALPLPQERLPPNRVLTRPKRISETFADDNPPGFADFVMRIERTALEHWYAHGAEIFSTHDSPAGPGEAATIAVGPFRSN